MDQKTKEFLQAELAQQNEFVRQSLEKQNEIIRAELDQRFEKWTQLIAGEFERVHGDIAEVRRIAQRIDDRTQNQVEALYEEVRVTERRVKRVEDQLGLPHTLVA